MTSSFVDLMDEKEIKDITNFIELILHPNFSSEELFLRVLQTPRTKQRQRKKKQTSTFLPNIRIKH